MKPHKYLVSKRVKDPMPPPKTVLKLNKLKEKGINVFYSHTPWYDKHGDKYFKAKEDKA